MVRGAVLERFDPGPIQLSWKVAKALPDSHLTEIVVRFDNLLDK